MYSGPKTCEVVEQLQGNVLTKATKQGNNSTQALSTKIASFGRKKIDRQQKKKEGKEENRQEGSDVKKCVKNHFASILFCCLSIFLHPKKTFVSKALVRYCFLCVSSHG